MITHLEIINNFGNKRMLFIHTYVVCMLYLQRERSRCKLHNFARRYSHILPLLNKYFSFYA